MEYKKEDLKVIINNRYTVKQAFCLFILGFNNCNNKNKDEIIKSIIDQMLKTKKIIEVLDKVNSKLLAEIENYWLITFEQLIAYAYIIFQNLCENGQDISEKNILDSFIYTMRLYSPNEAVEFAERNCLKI